MKSSLIGPPSILYVSAERPRGQNMGYSQGGPVIGGIRYGQKHDGVPLN